MSPDNERKGLVLDLSSDDYHSADGAVSKTMLDLVRKSPALLKWIEKAPVDPEAKKAVDMGNAFEALLLEPRRFAKDYITAPEVDRRTTRGKTIWAQFLKDSKDKNVISDEEMRVLGLMRKSAYAHPMVERILSADFYTQASYYWTDPVTDLKCKCRPDILCEKVPIVADLKVSADIPRFRRNLTEFRYHVQSAFYSDGLANYYGEPPWFVFIVVCTSRQAGRYPVHVYELDIDSQAQGVNEYREDLEHYQKVLDSGDFTDLETLSLPRWAKEAL